MKGCPFCQKEVDDNAFKCKFCGGWFSNDAEDKQKVLDWEEQAKKILRPQKDKIGEELSENTECFSVSTNKLVVMSFLTCGYYELYWFFRNWRAIKIQENKKLSPFWRTILSVFYCYTLFKRMLAAAVAKGYQGKQTPGSLASLYIIFVIIASKAPTPIDLIGIFSFIPIIYVNNAIRVNNVSINPQYQEHKPFAGGEIAFIIVGIIIWILNIMYFLYPETV